MISQAMAQIQIAGLDVIGAQIAAHVTNRVPDAGARWALGPIYPPGTPELA